MKAQQDELPIPDLERWMTRTAVAERLHVDKATVSRWAAAGVLTAYTPRRAPGESAQQLFYVTEVEELAAARRKMAGRRVA
jgi:predicted site-specific integrase-resolvase